MTKTQIKSRLKILKCSAKIALSEHKNKGSKFGENSGMVYNKLNTTPSEEYKKCINEIAKYTILLNVGTV